MKLSTKLLQLAFLLFCTISYGQYTDVINSNRPGVSRSAYSVGTNVIQGEFGAKYLKEEHTPLEREVKGFGLDFALRYGLLFEQLEIIVEGNYQNDTETIYSSSIPFENDRSNFRHFLIGAKYLVYDPYKGLEDKKPNLYSWNANHSFHWKDLIPAISLYAGANFDSKNNPYTAAGIEGFSPTIMLATQNNFPSGWVFVMNLVMDRIGTDQSDFQYIFTLTKAFSAKWVAFGETQGIKSDFYADNLFRLGGAYLWNRNLQLDTSLTFNTKDTPSVFNVGLGVSYRLDFHKDKVDNNTSADQEAKRRANKQRGSGTEPQPQRNTDF
ncbi:transporter [Mangrovimonas aestuarii]|uniref:transporter n=1 Tax=Mangrovimonas aestuarii TaxID=3018443 RepID=UPI002378A4E7|nr:transporter [Mangrovimonas aestuarii]